MSSMNIRTSNDEPPESHGRHDHGEKTLEMLLEVYLRELHTDHKQAHSEDNAHDLERDLVFGLAPGARVEHTCDIRADDDSKRRPEDDLIDVDLQGLASLEDKRSGRGEAHTRSSAIWASCAVGSQSASRSSTWRAIRWYQQPHTLHRKRICTIVIEFLPALAADPRKLGAQLLRLERLEPVHLLALLRELSLLPRLALLARVLPHVVLASHCRLDTPRIPLDLRRVTA